MIYEKKKEENCVRYSGEEFKGKGLEMNRLGVHAVYCDDCDEEDEEVQ
jgi:hypothetical protein